MFRFVSKYFHFQNMSFKKNQLFFYYLKITGYNALEIFCVF
jgi:hypothetical protein